jgi:hypothetical protein
MAVTYKSVFRHGSFLIPTGAGGGGDEYKAYPIKIRNVQYKLILLRIRYYTDLNIDPTAEIRTQGTKSLRIG